MPAVIAEAAGFQGDIYFSRHHESHAASAFFCSPFERAAILVADGVGEWATTSIGDGDGNRSGCSRSSGSRTPSGSSTRR